jgi:hypothetical protein
MNNNDMRAAAALLTKIETALAVANAAEGDVKTAQAELVSRSNAVGVLLLEAKKLYPAVKDFEAFLKRVDGLKLSRAYDLLRLAGGRTTDEEIRKATRDRVKKHRSKKKPEPLSVTSTPVTESPKPEPRKVPEWMDAAERSSRALAEFTYAACQYLPRITVEADREEARRLVDNLLAPSKAEAA